MISAHICHKYYGFTVTLAALLRKVRASAVFVKTRIVVLMSRNEKDITVIHYWF